MEFIVSEDLVNVTQCELRAPSSPFPGRSEVRWEIEVGGKPMTGGRRETG